MTYRFLRSITLSVSANRLLKCILNFTLRRYRLLAENGRVKSHVATSKYTKGDCKSADGQRMSGADLS